MAVRVIHEVVSSLAEQYLLRGSVCSYSSYIIKFGALLAAVASLFRSNSLYTISEVFRSGNNIG